MTQAVAAKIAVTSTLCLALVCSLPGCGDDKKVTGPEKADVITNELTDFSGLFRVVIEYGIRSGPAIFYTDTLAVDTANICPGPFPLVGESRPENGYTITSESGIITDTLVEFNQAGSMRLRICNDQACEDFDTCTVPFNTKISSRRTGRHPTSQGFQVIITTNFKNCEGDNWESIERCTFERIGDADCATITQGTARVTLPANGRSGVIFLIPPEASLLQ